MGILNKAATPGAILRCFEPWSMSTLQESRVKSWILARNQVPVVNPVALRAMVPRVSICPQERSADFHSVRSCDLQVGWSGGLTVMCEQPRDRFQNQGSPSHPSIYTVHSMYESKVQEAPYSVHPTVATYKDIVPSDSKKS